MGFIFLLFVVGVWGVLTIFVLQRWSGVELSPAASRGFGFGHVALGALGAALTQLASNEPVYANLMSNLMVSFSSAVAGIYVARGYFINQPIDGNRIGNRVNRQ